MMMRIVLGIIMFLLGLSRLTGQSDSLAYNQPLFSIKIAPSAAMNFSVPAAQAGVEYRIFENFTVSHEFGVMTEKKPYLWRRGYRHLTEIRWYLTEFDPNAANFYLGFQYRNWRFKAVDEGIFCRQNCLFTQTMIYQIDQSAHGPAISSGVKVFPIKDKFFLEFGASSGRIDKTNKSDLPEDADLTGFNIVFFDLFGLRNRWQDYEIRKLHLHINFRMGYIIK